MNPCPSGVVRLPVEEGMVTGLKLFRATKDGTTEVEAHLAEVEADVQCLIEMNMETLLDVRFLASEYVIDCVDGGASIRWGSTGPALL